jgi:biotin carboxyl carrier protein
VKLKAEIGDHSSDVEVTRAGELVLARVDERATELRVSNPEAGLFLMQTEGHVYEAAFSEIGPNTVSVRLGGFEVSVRLHDQKRLRGSAAEGGASSGNAEIRTAMPGKVVRLLKKSGDAVTKGESMIVVEAMKMQNEIKAPHDGTVGDVRVKEGDTVGAGDVLLVLG